MITPIIDCNHATPEKYRIYIKASNRGLRPSLKCHRRLLCKSKAEVDKIIEILT